ncbi:MAG: phenylacetate--CoA ligase family protein [Planctomycetes bacterium]|nr:phenylacetate--CoA ligase family protein [Planctomycetota bacterium]
MPRWLVRLILYPLHEILRGRSTYRFLRRFRKTEKLTVAEVERGQLELLRDLVAHAAEQSPYWRAFFAASGIDPTGVGSRARLQELPFMDKALIRERREELVADSWRERVFRLETGGSSGVPLSFYTDKERESSQLAAKARAREWFGIRFGDHQMDLWGSPIELGANDRRRIAKDRLLNFRLLSAFQLSDQKMAGFRSELEGHRTEFVYGYASVLARYARFLRDRGEDLRSLRLKAAIATAELLLPEDRELIGAVFGCPVVNEYGCRDGGYIAQSCPEGRLHLAADAVLVEVVDDEGRALPSGEVGEIVVTNLWSYGMPLIRYRLGDRAALLEESCPCGRSLPLLGDLQGRKTDTLVTVDGNRIHGLGAMYVLRVMPEVARYQVIQDALDHLEILVVANPDADLATAEATIRRGFGSLMGPDCRLDVRFVAEIPELASGKLRAVWNKLEP